MLNIVWDASHLWGYLMRYAVRAVGLEYRLIRASDIAQAGLSGKVLAVPGGSARMKAKALGAAGVEAVRRFVAGGGHYLGVCGGAGLALADGLALCPWRRADLADRLQHLVSGHIHCAIPAGATAHALAPGGRGQALLPVWWPGRFAEPDAPDDGSDPTGTGGPTSGTAQAAAITVLARYAAPGPDLYVADLPFAAMPPDVLTDWEALYGVTMRPSLLDGEPCVITGRYGRGDWVLSYSHLETPAEPEQAGTDANAWFFHLLRAWGLNPETPAAPGAGTDKSLCLIRPWLPQESPVRWEDATLLTARAELDELLHTARSLGLLFPRASWLMGWRSGVPGAQLNSLRLALLTAMELKPTPARHAVWNHLSPGFSQRFRLFCQGARSWLLARRLADTLADALATSRPDVLPRGLLADQRRELFGSPMFSGGLCGLLIEELEQLLFV